MVKLTARKAGEQVMVDGFRETDDAVCAPVKASYGSCVSVSPARRRVSGHLSLALHRW
jgi:hypothetical protein